MKKLMVASHTGTDRIELWLVVRAIDTTDNKLVMEVKTEIRRALCCRIPEDPQYDRAHDVTYGPFTDEYALSEDAYRAIMGKFPDGNITPRDRWVCVLDDLGLTNDWDAHRFEVAQ
jgi:hypothetical protein